MATHNLTATILREKITGLETVACCIDLNVQGLSSISRGTFTLVTVPPSMDLMNCESDRTKESEVKLDFIEDCTLEPITACAGNRMVSGNFNLETEGPSRSLRKNFHWVGYWHRSIFR